MSLALEKGDVTNVSCNDVLPPHDDALTYDC